MELLTSIANAVRSGEQLALQRDQQQQSVAMQLAEQARQQQEFQQKLSFQKEQQARIALNEAFSREMQAADEARASAKFQAAQADLQPVAFSGSSLLPTDGGASFIPVSGAPDGVKLNLDGSTEGSGEGLLGKVTSYGYASDPHGDTASLGTGKFKFPTGAWNNRLTASSLAISPDVEAAFKAAGIGKGDPVQLKLSNGQVITRTWDDRTAQDEDVLSGRIKGVTKPLRGRFDLYSPGGQHEFDGVAVTGFAPVGKGSAGASLIQSFDRPPVAETVSGPSAPQMSMARQLAGPERPLSVAESLMQAFQQADAVSRAQTGLPAFNVGSMREAVSRVLPQMVAARARTQAGTDLLAGMVPNPENNTYKDENGMEFFVTRSSNGTQKLTPYRPQAVKASRWTIGSDGRPYALGNDGQPMQPIPDDVTLDFNPGKMQTVRDNSGNVFAVGADRTLQMLLPAKTKLSREEREKYMADLEAQGEAQAELEAVTKALQEKGERGLTNWFGVSDSSLRAAQTAADEAGRKVAVWRERYPDLQPIHGANTTNPVSPLAAQPNGAQDARSVSIQRAREALTRNPNARAAIVSRLEGAGITDHGL